MRNRKSIARMSLLNRRFRIRQIVSRDVSSPAFPTGVLHVLLHVAVTPNIDLDAMKYKDHWILLILVLHIIFLFSVVVLL